MSSEHYCFVCLFLMNLNFIEFNVPVLKKLKTMPLELNLILIFVIDNYLMVGGCLNYDYFVIDVLSNN